MTGEQARHGVAAAHQIFDTACQALREGMFPEAIDALESLLEKDVDFPGAASALKCAGFWRERGEKDEAPLDGFERGEQLLGQWRLFQAFAERLADMPERCMFAIKQFVFSSALAGYGSAAPDAEAGGDPYVLLQIGRCCKGIGQLRARHRVPRARQPGVTGRRADPRGAGRLLLAGQRVAGGKGVLSRGLLRRSTGDRPRGPGVAARAAPGRKAAGARDDASRSSASGSRSTAPSGACSA